MKFTKPADRSSYRVRPDASGVMAYSTVGGLTYEGHVTTSHGFVEVFVLRNTVEGGLARTEGGFTTMQFVHKGRHHYWRWDRSYSKRYLATLAQRMATSIVAKRSR